MSFTQIGMRNFAFPVFKFGLTNSAPNPEILVFEIRPASLCIVWLIFGEFGENMKKLKEIDTKEYTNRPYQIVEITSGEMYIIATEYRKFNYNYSTNDYEEYNDGRDINEPAQNVDVEKFEYIAAEIEPEEVVKKYSVIDHLPPLELEFDFDSTEPDDF